MKVRSGFVSNSSSSSFIIGWGVVKNRNAFDVYCKEHNIEIGDYQVDFISTSRRKHFDDWGYEISGGNVTSIDIPEKYKDNNDLLIVDIGNNEGDGGGSPFWQDGHESGYEKAEDLNFFSKHQQNIARMLQDKSLFKDSYVKWGAERDG